MPNPSRRFQDWIDIYQIVKANPGIYKRNLADMINCGAREMEGKMCGMDNAGYYLAEDDIGRLWVMDESIR